MDLKISRDRKACKVHINFAGEFAWPGIAVREADDEAESNLLGDNVPALMPAHHRGDSMHNNINSEA